MNILLVSASLPYPPQQGGALRTFGILRGLVQAGHSIGLLSFHDQATGATDGGPLTEYCTFVETVSLPQRGKLQRLRDLAISGAADIEMRLFSRDFGDRLLALMQRERFDLVQFEGIEVARYLQLARQHFPQARLVYDAFNAEAALQRVIFEVDRRNPRRWAAAAYSLIQSQRIARFEERLCQQADLVIAVSDEDARILRPLRQDGQIAVVPNGIFADQYTNKGEHLDLGERALVFTGKMDYRPNVDAMLWFCETVLPAVQGTYPDARLVIVGQKPHPRLDGLRTQRGVEITGWVTDVQPFLHSAALYVAPLRMGSGTRLKILEAMASGCAVVATHTAASGLAVQAKEVMVIADDPNEQAQAVIRLLGNEEQRKALGTAARAFARAHYDWSVLIPELLNAYRIIGRG